MFGFSRTLGADYRGQWLSNTTFEIEIVTIGQANVDATSTSLEVRCKATTNYPIKDALERNLQSACLSTTISGSFGQFEPAQLIGAYADDPDNSDGTLSAGDVIRIVWATPTDRGVTVEASVQNDAAALSQLASSAGHAAILSGEVPTLMGPHQRDPT